MYGIWDSATLPNDDEIWLEVEYLGSAADCRGSLVRSGKINILDVAAAVPSDASSWSDVGVVLADPTPAKFALIVEFTPQQTGWVYARICTAGDPGARVDYIPFYVDPALYLS